MAHDHHYVYHRPPPDPEQPFAVGAARMKRPPRCACGCGRPLHALPGNEPPRRRHGYTWPRYATQQCYQLATGRQQRP